MVSRAQQAPRAAVPPSPSPGGEELSGGNKQQKQGNSPTAVHPRGVPLNVRGKSAESAVAKPPTTNQAPAEGKRHEVLGLLSLALTILLSLALASYDTRGGRDWCGPIGATVAEACVAVLGIAAVLMPLALLLQSIRFFSKNTVPFSALRVIGTLTIVASVATATHLWLGETPMLGHLAAGGLIGISLGETLRALIGTAGAQIVVLTALLVALVVRTRLSVVAFAKSAQTAGVRTGQIAKNGAVTVARAWQQARSEEQQDKATQSDGLGEVLEQIEDVQAQTDKAMAEVLKSHHQIGSDAFYVENSDGSDDGAAHDLLSTASSSPAFQSAPSAVASTPVPLAKPLVARTVAPSAFASAPVARVAVAQADTPQPVVAQSASVVTPAVTTPTNAAIAVEPESPVALSKRKTTVRKRSVAGDEISANSQPSPAVIPLEAPPASAPVDAPAALSTAVEVEAPRTSTPPSSAPTVAASVAKPEEPATPEPLPIVMHEAEIAAALETPPETVSPAIVRVKTESTQEFEFPSVSVLTPAPKDGFTVDEGQLRIAAEKLLKTLRDYQIEGEIVEIHPGPVVTTFEFLPTAGTKLSRIAARSDDIAMSLAVNKVRIVAPIPGKGRVGFEIPNAQRKTVYLRELVDAEAFARIGGALPVALGKDVVGAPFFSDLAAMPHLIVAGATGQGKSVGLNVMICSLLYKRTPDEVRMLMIDPKMVELAVYDGIPHMLLPVVTDMKKAALALRWVVDEMERRYMLFAQTGSRNVTTYNERVVKSLQDGVPMKGFNGNVRAKETGTTVDVSKLAEGDAPPPEVKQPGKLPYIVVVVDEFADLMMVAGKEVEAAVARLAQKARAAGIHVILATQRPSVDVITGMIKANFPSRVAFKVGMKVDSRTILDQQGAENLLGRGDMLILPPGSSDLRRVHCAFVSEDEVQAITDHWRKQGTPTYDEEILKPREEETESEEDEPEIRVPMEKYEKAVALVLSSRRCSVSWIQRQLAIGYNVAARMVERMEREGLVSSPRGPGKDREILR